MMVTVGVVLKPVGLKGELKVMPLTDNPGRFVPGGRVWLPSPEGEPAAFTIRSVSAAPKGQLRLALDGIDTLDDAVKYRGKEFSVPEDEVPPLPEGEYYHYQILGLSVYTHGGMLLGKVTDIFTAGEKDVYEVKGGGREYLIPVNRDTVREVDLKGGRILLYRMEGYIPEDEV